MGQATVRDNSDGDGKAMVRQDEPPSARSHYVPSFLSPSLFSLSFFRHRRVLFAVASFTVASFAVALLAFAGPNRYGHSDRVERHMLPHVSTGPMDPAWSPDGRWIAFSMRGDIWKVPADGGEAVALTVGPAYHFEPAWSPDGTRLALSMDIDGNLDIGVVGADGGSVERVTTHAQVDVEPAWGRDGKSLFFVSARGDGRFRIYRQQLGDTAAVPVVGGIQPAPSPDGLQLAYVASVPGRLGTGGLWVKSLADTSAPRLVHYEETEYRMKPAWLSSGQAFLYVSDEMGSNDVATIPVAGGNPVVLTADATRDEYAPSPNPDGTRFAFVSNRTGPPTLYTVDVGGGPLANWREVPIQKRRPRQPSGRVRIRVLGPDNRPMPARIYLQASDGRGYAPDRGFHRVSSATETHYFHTTGESEVEVPAGRASVEALRGHEWRPHAVTLEVPAGGVQTATLRLERLIDMPARGWYSGDTHGHDLHQGNFGLTHEAFFQHLVAEDLHVFNSLVHMDGTRLMGRWGDLTGKPHPLSTPAHILQYGEEYRGSLGHLALVGIKTYVLPFNTGATNTAFAQPVLGSVYIDATHAQGGIAGFGHPFAARITRPSGLSGSSIPVDFALGKGDFYDVAAMSSDEMYSTELYYQLLNCGFRIAATGGTDNFGDVSRDTPPGGDRTYVRVEGPLTLASWMAGIKAQRTFASTGPIVLLEVAGRGPGGEIALGRDAPPTLRVRAEVVSIAPIDTLEIIVNGAVARAVRASDAARLVFDDVVPIPQGGWIAARVRGPSSRYVTDSYAFAQTSPVYVVRNGRRYVSAADARFLGEGVDALWARFQDIRWRSTAEMERFRSASLEAREVYRRLEQEATETSSR
ncbi:MAG: CehA/McbA family metallohydrolase [Gemmatimonadetes bacterium]|nr:CehA/McbA family metallohydrolase [Gemmatimonadota bacterium]